MNYHIEESDEEYQLVDSDGTVVATYDEQPAHPPETAEDVLDDIGVSGPEREAILYILKKGWRE